VAGPAICRRPGCLRLSFLLLPASRVPTPPIEKRFPRGLFPDPRNLDAHSSRSGLPTGLLFSTSPIPMGSKLLPEVVLLARGNGNPPPDDGGGHQWHGRPRDPTFLIGAPKLLPSQPPGPQTRPAPHLLNYWRLLRSSSAHRELVPLMPPPNHPTQATSPLIGGSFYCLYFPQI
jgi:hypothetical protein